MRRPSDHDRQMVILAHALLLLLLLLLLLPRDAMTPPSDHGSISFVRPSLACEKVVRLG